MRIIEEKLTGRFYDSRIFSEYFGGKKLAVADIETTGLTAKRHRVMLGGAVTEEDGCLVMRQYFAETPDDEAALLEAYAGLLTKQDVLITYNGNSFDIPFLIKRMQKYGMDTEKLESMYPLDLYRVIAKHSHLKKLLPDLKQKTVEAYMGSGAARRDEISGAESVKQYEKYLRCNDICMKNQLMDAILLHNRDDVVQLAGMLRILKSLDLHKIVFTEGIDISIGDRKMLVKNISVTKGMIRAEGRLTGDLSDFSYYGEGLTVDVSRKTNTAEIAIECEDVSGYLVADVKKLGVDHGPIQKLGGYESGYLIIKDKKAQVMYHEINTLIACAVAMVLQ